MAGVATHHCDYCNSEFWCTKTLENDFCGCYQHLCWQSETDKKNTWVVYYCDNECYQDDMDALQAATEEDEPLTCGYRPVRTTEDYPTKCVGECLCMDKNCKMEL